MSLFAKKQPDVGSLRPMLDHIHAASRNVASAEADRAKVVQAIERLEPTLVVIEEQRNALAAKIREGALAVALAEGPDEDGDLRKLRADEELAGKRAAELSRTLADLRAKLEGANAAVERAEVARREATRDALWKCVGELVLPEYMAAANDFILACRGVFAMQELIKAATGVDVMLLSPGAAKNTYIPSLNGAPSEALYMGRDSDSIRGVHQAAIDAEREKLAKLGIVL